MSINFYCIRKNESNKVIVDLFKEACQKNSINYVDVNIDNFDVTNELNTNNINLLYRAATGYQAKQIELHLLNSGNFITLYKSPENSFFDSQDISLHQRNNIPMPKTITYTPSNKKLLSKYAESVGGFPLIVKVTGLSHGAGVMKIDSMSSLCSVLDYIKGSGNQKIVLREFIKSSEHARLIVLGNKVIDSIAYIAQDDFRTNVGEPCVEPRKFGKDFEDIAVKAVQSMNLEFGGVDILIGKNNKPYLAEVNMPCYFPRCQLITNVDIASEIIKYMLNKK